MMYINNKKAFVTNCEDVMLIPGITTVDDAAKEKALHASPMFKELCAGGVLEEVKTETSTASKPGAPSKPASKPINTLSAPEAIKLINGMLSIDELEAVAKLDARKAIQDAVKKQIAKVKE